MIALQGLSPSRLVRLLPVVPIEDARKIVSAVFRKKPLSPPPRGVRRVSVDAVLAACDEPTLEIVTEERSQVDPFRKLVVKTPDGELVETVRIPLEKPGRFSVCVSSQVGCALACAFCATGRMGLRRNLETWEIIEQVRLIRADLDPAKGERVHGVVFQGMGEPMANLDRVLAAIEVMTDPCALAIDAKNITVCTSGLPTGIRRLAVEQPNVRLGLSIGGARPAVRRSLMPIDAAHSLDEVLDAVAEHATRTRNSPMWAVTPLAGVNDGEEDARALAKLALAFAARTGVRPRVSIVPYNRISEGDDPFVRQDDARALAFRAAMASEGVFAHLRYSGGGDVAAACGQLRAQVVKSAE
jgi:23S rRNA (adenine2503-C2)-methyltransferase